MPDSPRRFTWLHVPCLFMTYVLYRALDSWLPDLASLGPLAAGVRAASLIGIACIVGFGPVEYLRRRKARSSQFGD